MYIQKLNMFFKEVNLLNINKDVFDNIWNNKVATNKIAEILESYAQDNSHAAKFYLNTNYSTPQSYWNTVGKAEHNEEIIQTLYTNIKDVAMDSIY